MLGGRRPKGLQSAPITVTDASGAKGDIMAASGGGSWKVKTEPISCFLKPAETILYRAIFSGRWAHPFSRARTIRLWHPHKLLDSAWKRCARTVQGRAGQVFVILN